MTTITLPPPPEALPADTFSARHRAWWEACDVILREAAVAASQAHGAAQASTAVALQAGVAAQNALAAAIGQTPASSGLSENFVLELLRIVRGAPEPAP